MQQALKNIIVTGANKGIGFGIAGHLASQQGWNLILACRNIELGQKAQQELKEKHPNASVQLQQLDVSDSKSIDQFIDTVKQKYKEIHVLVNNAGVAVKGDGFDLEGIKWTFQTNFYGTIEFTEKMIPVLSEKGKVVTLGSTAGRMAFNKITNDDLKKRWRKEGISRQQIFDLMKEYENAVGEGNYLQKGWPKWGYGVSKLGINVYHSALARNEDIKKKNIQVYVCCPGYVKTDMTSHKGVLPIEEGIKTPVFLIESPSEVNNEWQGGFFYEQKHVSAFDA